MYGAMAIATKRNGLLHMLASEPFLEPFVRMARSRNQMMLRGAVFHNSQTEFTLALHGGLLSLETKFLEVRRKFH